MYDDQIDYRDEIDGCEEHDDFQDTGDFGFYDDEHDDEHDDDDDMIDGVGFAEPGARSGPRVATDRNPRDLPCPSCGPERQSNLKAAVESARARRGLTPEQRVSFAKDRRIERANGLQSRAALAKATAKIGTPTVHSTTGIVIEGEPGNARQARTSTARFTAARIAKAKQLRAERKPVATAKTVEFDLAALMRKHKVTVRELARRMNVSQKAVRKYRAMTRVSYPTYCDYSEGVTGISVFSRARYDAIERQRSA